MPGYITSVEELAPYLGQPLKYSWNGGKTWQYVRLAQEGPHEFQSDYGYAADCEVSPAGTPQRYEFTDEYFAQGMIVLPATPEEVQGKRWSYDDLR